MKTQGFEMNAPWWREASIYQVYPRSFMDSNGDGDGDIPGVVQKLDYLVSLGIDAIWLSPFYTTPNNDGGYDVANPRDVDPRFGDLNSADFLIEKSHEFGLKVIVDLVPNHFSTAHPWFVAALNSAPQSAERKRFHFYDGKGEHGELPPNNWCSIFGGSAWTRVTEMDGRPGQWYLHLFDESQADLNWENSDVHDDFERTIRFWLDKGVDGFRIDVAHGLVKDEIHKDHRDPEALTRALRLDVGDMPQAEREALLADVPFFDREGVHEIYRKWRRIIDSYEGEHVTVAEAWVHPSSRAVRYVRKDELHQIFNFDFLIAQWDGEFLQQAIDKTLSEVAVVGAPATWVLCNHDSPRLVSRLGGGDSGRLKARAMALLTHALPGGVYIYQGEELGLEDVMLPDSARQDPVFFRTKGLDKGRDGARVPIPWKAKQNNYGFSTGRPWLPMPDYWDDLTVSNQSIIDVETPNSYEDFSYLDLYRRSMRLRRKLKGHEFSWVYRSRSLLAFTRGENYLVISNVSNESETFPAPENFRKGKIVLCSTTGASFSEEVISIPANATLWIAR